MVELGFPWHYIYLPRVVRAGNLTSKNLAKTALCPKASVYLSGFAKSQLNAATNVTLLSSDHVFLPTEEVHGANSVQPFKGDRRLSLKTARDLEGTCRSGAGTAAFL